MAELRGGILHFDCFSGIAGDMTLGALLDLGVPLEVFTAELQKLPLAGYKLWHERVKRGALVGTKAHVDIARQETHGFDHDHAQHHAGEPHHHDEHHHHHEHSHTHWSEIRAMLK